MCALNSKHHIQLTVDYIIRLHHYSILMMSDHPGTNTVLFNILTEIKVLVNVTGCDVITERK